MKEIEALNFENQLLHKLLSSEKEYIKKIKKSLEYFKEKSNSQIKGSPERLLDSIKEYLKKTADNLGQITKSDALPKLLFNIKNTMTDRHSVNDCVDDMQEKWKTEVAEASVSGFEEMNERAKKIYTSVNKLRCNLSFLLGLADAAEKGLNQYNKIVQNNGIIAQKSESRNMVSQAQQEQLVHSAKHFKNMDLNKQVSCHIFQYISEILLSN